MTIAHKHILEMAAYQLAELIPPKDKKLISLCQNESLRPPSPLALEAANEVMAYSMLYPDPNWTRLRNAIAEVYSVNAENVLCGNGSLDLIGAMARVFAGPERAVLAPEHAYPFFKTATQLAQARFDTATENNITVDVSSLLASVQHDTGIVFVANPGNPTGTRIPKSELIRLREGLRDDILLVIDEAYGEFADHLGESCYDMAGDGPTVILRTFSKAYGMAGFRLGWGLFPPTIAAEIRKVLNPNNITGVAQAAAIGALQDQQHMFETCTLVEEVKLDAINELQQAGFRVSPSFTNFILIDVEDVNRARQADALLRSDGIFLRGQSGVGLPNMLRMTIGPRKDVELAVAKLVKWRKGRA